MSSSKVHDNENSVSVAGEGAGVDAEAEIDDPAGLRRRTRNFVLGMMAIGLSLIGIGGALIKTDYVALMPGSARDTEPLLSIEGTETFPSDGELMFTTVQIREDLILWEYLWRKMDDDVRLVPTEVVRGDRTTEENREVNLQAMVDSKTVAVAVALQELGYDAIQPDGVFLAQVIEGAAADGVLIAGDIIREVNGTSILAASELVEILGTISPGDSVELLVEPQEGDIELRTLVLGAKEDDPDAAFLGVSPQTLIDFSNLDVEFEIDIDSGAVGGPSAGLAFTLAILDQLTPGELSGGGQIAITGTMSIDGSVGPVGGVAQKAAAVRDLGIEHFIVPSSLGEERIQELRDVVDGKVEIIPVDNLSQALEVLERLGGEVSALSEYASTVVAAE